MASNILNKRKRPEDEQLDGQLEKKPLISAEEFMSERTSSEDEEFDGELENNSSMSAEEFMRRERANFEKMKIFYAEYDYPLCEEVTKYEKIAKIGHGTFGEVFKARHSSKGNIVALKKILRENEEEMFPSTALWEINILKRLKHENIIDLIEVCRKKGTPATDYRDTFYIVFEFCEHDLAGLLNNTQVRFSLGEKKMIMKQIFQGLFFMHENKILHRDIKAANILVTKDGILKIADFGLARAFSNPRDDKPNCYTNKVVTLWYRPPELLLGERNYGPPIDLWGAGCIMAELWTKSPIMKGNTEQHQLNLICQLCGSITPETFENVEKLDLYNRIVLPKEQKCKIRERLEVYVKDEHALDLLEKLLTIDPARRIDSDSALFHYFFWDDPLPCDLAKTLQPIRRSLFEFYKGKVDFRPTAAGHCVQPPPTADDGQFHDRVF